MRSVAMGEGDEEKRAFVVELPLVSDSGRDGGTADLVEKMSNSSSVCSSIVGDEVGLFRNPEVLNAFDRLSGHGAGSGVSGISPWSRRPSRYVVQDPSRDSGDAGTLQSLDGKEDEDTASVKAGKMIPWINRLKRSDTPVLFTPVGLKRMPSFGSDFGGGGGGGGPRRRPSQVGERGVRRPSVIEGSLLRVLIADESSMTRHMVTRLMRWRCSLCDEAANGVEALNKVKELINRDELPYDVILMDMVLPQMNGPETVAEIRKLGYTGAIIGVTACMMPVEIQLFRESGADRVLAKPLDVSKLEKTLIGTYVM